MPGDKSEGRPQMRTQKFIETGLIVVLVAMPCLALAQDAPHNTPTLNAGAIELGVGGTMTTTEGITRGAVVLRGGWFYRGFGGLGGIEINGGYRHVSSLDATDIGFDVSWQKRFRGTGNYPFVAVGGGLRHEDIGSFAQTLYPLGFSLGVRSLLGQRGGFRVEYRFQRIFNDPSANFTEHRLLVGLSVFFENH